MAPRLIGIGVGSSEIKSEHDYILLLFPMNVIRDSVIPATNEYGHKANPKWKLFSNDEFLHFLGFLLSMEVVEIHGPRRLYWSSGYGIFPGMKYWDIISYSRFEDTMKNLQLLHRDDPNQQLLDFLEATNT